jgi:peptidoglycan/xylan/chitin deacetylase (PgdA/CDA1 family)
MVRRKFTSKTAPVLFVSLLLFLGISSVSAQSSCNCAAFRLDSVQDYWLKDVQKAIIQAFVDTDTPLTLGVLGDYFGKDLDYVHFLRDQTVRNPTTPLEVACNGWANEDFTTMDVSTQTNLLQTATRTIEKYLWVPPIKVFIPPQGKYNENTLTAMRNRNMTHISTFTSTDSVRPYSLSGQSVYRFPSGAGMQSLSNPSVGITAQQAYSQLSIGIARDGFSVVQLSVTAFAQKSGGVATNAVNQTMINELKNLLTMTRSGGYSIVPISKINLDAPIAKAPVNYTDIYSCNCVAFRIDDIQDFYMTAQQYSLMNTFLDNHLGVTVGIIANNFGSDTDLVNFISSKASNPANMFEISNHGLYHEDFSTLTQSEAVSRLTQAQSIIQAATGFRPSTLLLPYNNFNNGTIAAIKSVGFTRFSSSIQMDPPLYDLSNPDLWHFPIASQTSDPYNTAYFNHIPGSQTWEAIQQQVDRDGFAVVMVHPQEFSTRNPDNSYTQALNQTALNDFINLINTVKNAGLRIVPVSGISSYLTQVDGSTSTTTGSTTGTQPSSSPAPTSGSTTGGQHPSSSPAATRQPSSSPASSGNPSSSPAATRQPSSSPAGNSGNPSDITSSSGKVQPFGALTILALVIAAIMGAQ